MVWKHITRRVHYAVLNHWDYSICLIDLSNNLLQIKLNFFVLLCEVHLCLAYYQDLSEELTMENLHPCQYLDIGSNVSPQRVAHLRRNYLSKKEKYLSSLFSLSFYCALFNYSWTLKAFWTVHPHSPVSSPYNECIRR